MKKIRWKEILPSILICYTLWGSTALYCALDPGIDTAFLLAARFFWACVFCTIMLLAQGKLPELKKVFSDKEVLKREIPAAVFLVADAALYLYGISRGQVMQCSMGYYIMPLVMVAFGALVFHEKLTAGNYVALGFIAAGIIFSFRGFGSFPWITIGLSVAFAIYSAIKKSLTIDTTVTTCAEFLIIAPFALLFILLFRMGDNGMAGLTLKRQFFVMGAGLFNVLPMLFFAKIVTALPMAVTGILQYLSPTLGLVSGVILGEELTREKLVSFALIWIGIIIYSAEELKRSKEKSPSEDGDVVS